MLDDCDSHPLADFTRHARDHIDRLHATGMPEVLTIDGQAAVVVQDAQAYQKLLDDADLADALVKVRRALDSLDRGDEGQPMRDVLEGLAAEAGFELKKK